MTTDYKIPDSWRELGKYERGSSMSDFVTGWVGPNKQEILVWKGIDTPGGRIFKLKGENEPPEKAKYVVQTSVGDMLKNEQFAETKKEAVSRALQQVQVFEEL